MSRKPERRACSVTRSKFLDIKSLRNEENGKINYIAQEKLER